MLKTLSIRTGLLSLLAVMTLLLLLVSGIGIYALTQSSASLQRINHLQGEQLVQLNSGYTLILRARNEAGQAVRMMEVGLLDDAAKAVKNINDEITQAQTTLKNVIDSGVNDPEGELLLKKVAASLAAYNDQGIVPMQNALKEQSADAYYDLLENHLVPVARQFDNDMQAFQTWSNSRGKAEVAAVQASKNRVMMLIIVAALAPWIVPFDAENYFDYDRLNDGPSMVHWFGVDSLGRDIFSRVLVGAQISLAAGVLAVLIGAAIGTVLGLLAGYYEGWWDRIIMRICDVLFAFPGILLAIAVVAVMGSGMSNVIIAVAVFSVPAFARLVRGNTLVLKQQTFIESARSIGASDATILFRHILPGTISSIVVYFTMRIGTSIISAASLSFLGLGAQPPTPEWGAMLNEARADMVIAPHVALFPSLAIFLTVLAFNLLGDGLRDALDPKIKG